MTFSKVIQQVLFEYTWSQLLSASSLEISIAGISQACFVWYSLAVISSDLSFFFKFLIIAEISSLNPFEAFEDPVVRSETSFLRLDIFI